MIFFQHNRRRQHPIVGVLFRIVVICGRLSRRARFIFAVGIPNPRLPVVIDVNYFKEVHRCGRFELFQVGQAYAIAQHGAVGVGLGAFLRTIVGPDAIRVVSHFAFCQGFGKLCCASVCDHHHRIRVAHNVVRQGAEIAFVECGCRC